jgi:hypothetical protein
VLGGGDSYLRAGPTGLGLTGSLGQGSLGIRTGSPEDKAAFGNSTLFNGTLVKNLTALSFSVFTTKENSRNGTSLANLPNLTFEIDPNMEGVFSDYSSLVFIPAPLTVEQSNSAWTSIDATSPTGGLWGLTGTHTACRLDGAHCTFADLKVYLDEVAIGPLDTQEAVITYSGAFSKGRDLAWSGAVDRLRVNNWLFDFEPFGVTTTTVPAP